MKFKIDGDTFKKATSDVKTGLGNKKVSAFYETIYIEANDGKVIIRTQDEGIRLTALCNCEIEETGSFRCEGKLFIDIAGQLSNDEPVEIYTVEKGDSEILHIKQRGVNVKIHSIDNMEINDKNDQIDNEFYYIVPSDELSEGLTRALTCVAKENNKPLLKGINICKRGNQITVASLDGFRISKYGFEILEGEDGQDFRVTIPTRCVPAVVSLCDSQKAIKIGVYSKVIMFSCDGGIVESALMEGQYFDYEKPFLTEPTIRIKVPTKEIKQALSVSLLTGDDKNNRVGLSVDTNTSELKMSSGKAGAESNIVIPYETLLEGDSTAIHLNGIYLLDCFKSTKDDSVVFNITDRTKPVVIGNDKDDNGFLLLPIRVIG